RGGPVRASRRLRTRPADHGPAGLPGPAAHQAACRHPRSEEACEDRSRARVPREAGRAPLPRDDGGARPGARRARGRRVRRRRGAHLDGREGRRRPEEAARRAPRLRRHEGAEHDRRAREAARRRRRTRSRAESSHARRRRLRPVAARIPSREARVQAIELRTLTDGGQPAAETANALAGFLGEAQTTLDIAVYDFHLPPDLNEIVCGALRAAAARNVAVRLAYNVDHPGDVPVPAPPRTDPDAMESLPFPTAAIPGVPDLMHHKYVIRDGSTLWTGSTNWTGDSWT